MTKLGSLIYLRKLNNLILKYNKDWRSLDEQKIELSEADEKKRDAAWREILALAEEIHGSIGVPE